MNTTIVTLLALPVILHVSAAQTVTVISPNGFQQWEAGTARTILYSAPGIDSIRIDYSHNNGTNWSTVAATTPATGSYLWTLPANPTNEGLVRVTSLSPGGVTDINDEVFSIVPPRTESTLDYVYFNDSGSPPGHDSSTGFVIPPSILELAGGLWPLAPEYSFVGNYSLKLAWTSIAGGDWSLALLGPARDVTTKDSLILHIFTETLQWQAALPSVYLEDRNGNRTPRIPLSTFFAGIPPRAWTRYAVPISAFQAHPGSADLTHIRGVAIAGDQPDGVAHVWYVDDVRMKSVRQYPDSIKLIVILGSSTAAGTGPSHPDSAWVARYRHHIASNNAPVAVVNLAVGGFTTYDVMPWGFVPPAGRPSPSAVNNISMGLAHRPAAFVVNLPSNDVAYGYSVAEQLTNYASLASISLGRNLPIWIGTSQPRNIADPLVRTRLQEVTDSIFTQYGDHAVDLWSGLSLADGSIRPAYDAGDGIHLNDTGHRIIFERMVGKHIWESLTSIEPAWHIPETFSLLQNYPNPFNPTTRISYRLSSAGPVTLRVYDLLGREVATLVDEPQPAGRHEIPWNARTSGSASGVFFCVLRAGEQVQTIKLVLMK